MPRKPRVPHCGSASHFVRCICEHERQAHVHEDDVCMERKCVCEKFRIKPGYPIKMLEHQVAK